MDDTRFAFLKRLIATPSPSGFEQPVQQVVREELAQYTDEIKTDVHGNVIAALNPAGSPRVMLTAHCDELGFLIRYIDEQGFLRFAPIGGFDPSTLPGNRVQIQTSNGTIPGVIGRTPVHLLGPDEKDKAPKLSDLWIDIGAANQEEAKKLVPLGSAGTRAATLEQLQGDVVTSRALDDKSSVFALIETMRYLHDKRDQLQAGVFFVSAVQEEVGSRGARTAAYSVDPLIAVAVDVTFTSDHPGVSKTKLGDAKLNGGPILSIGGNINPRVYNLLVKAAEETGLSWQIDPEAGATWTDTDVIQTARGGVATALVSIPCRYLHTGSEVVSLKDVEGVSTLLTRFVLNLTAETNVIP